MKAMKCSPILIGVALLLGCSGSKEPGADNHNGHGGGQHGDHGGSTGAMLMVETVPKVLRPGEPGTLNLMIHDADGAMVRDFEVIHDKLAHLIVVRDGLDEFAHIHPEVDSQGNLRATHVFPKAGKYRLFVDYKPKGKAAATAKASVEVAGTAPPAIPLSVNAPGRITADGLIAELELRDPKAEQEAGVWFRLHNADGQPLAAVQTYLGARGHLVVISADGSKYVHAHPEETATSANEVRFAAHFPAAGVYKGWGQFLIEGHVRTVPFVVQIP